MAHIFEVWFGQLQGTSEKDAAALREQLANLTLVGELVGAASHLVAYGDLRTVNSSGHCKNYAAPIGLKFLGSGFGRTDFSRIFIFEPPDFFADFLAGFFLLIFVGKSAQKNPPGKSPAKSSKIYTTKILQHISADCPGQKFLRSRGLSSTVSKVRSDRKVLFEQKNGPLIAINGR